MAVSHGRHRIHDSNPSKLPHRCSIGYGTAVPLSKTLELRGRALPYPGGELYGLGNFCELYEISLEDHHRPLQTRAPRVTYWTSSMESESKRDSRSRQPASIGEAGCGWPLASRRYAAAVVSVASAEACCK